MNRIKVAERIGRERAQYGRTDGPWPEDYEALRAELGKNVGQEEIEAFENAFRTEAMR